jgi:hypothetical protein
MKKEYDLRKMKVKRRGSLVAKTAKVLKTVRLDAEVLRWLCQEADERGIGYQTLLNMFLRERMKAKRGRLRSEIRAIVREELRRARLWESGPPGAWASLAKGSKLPGQVSRSDLILAQCPIWAKSSAETLRPSALRSTHFG